MAATAATLSWRRRHNGHQLLSCWKVNDDETIGGALLGIFFGIVLVKSRSSPGSVFRKMFRFEEAHMYLIIASAVVARTFRFSSSSGGKCERCRARWCDRGEVLQQGGDNRRHHLWHGLGDYRRCPGLIYAQWAAGLMAVITFVAALGGSAYLYAFLHQDYLLICPGLTPPPSWPGRQRAQLLSRLLPGRRDCRSAALRPRPAPLAATCTDSLPTKPRRNITGCFATSPLRRHLSDTTGLLAAR